MTRHGRRSKQHLGAMYCVESVVAFLPSVLCFVVSIMLPRKALHVICDFVKLKLKFESQVMKNVGELTALLIVGKEK